MFVSYQRPYSTHAGRVGIDRRLLTEHNAPLLRQIARDLFMHYHIDMITNGMAFGEPVGVTGGNKWITY